MLHLERGFADPMLLGMVDPAQVDAEPIGRLEPSTPVGAAPDMRAFDRKLGATRH